jgi:hypothetical protein
MEVWLQGCCLSVLACLMRPTAPRNPRAPEARAPSRSRVRTTLIVIGVGWILGVARCQVTLTGQAILKIEKVILPSRSLWRMELWQ